MTEASTLIQTVDKTIKYNATDKQRTVGALVRTGSTILQVYNIRKDTTNWLGITTEI